ncbi:MAG TPA: hypothetical protein VHA77_16370 [Xanthobacteraceae bacterium]|jgi:hypothetical protein|nr:hypothetical protein [Xanthobacteraceae bacterium]
MRRCLIALGALVCLAAPASAQVYPDYGAPAYRPYAGPSYYYPYRYRRPHYYGERGIYPRRYWGSPDFLAPRYDPRNGGLYCLDPRFTVQDGICKPYRGG